MNDMLGTTRCERRPDPWNKGKIVGQKAPLKLKDIWALRVRLQMADRLRERRCGDYLGSTKPSVTSRRPAMSSRSPP